MQNNILSLASSQKLRNQWQICQKSLPSKLPLLNTSWQVEQSTVGGEFQVLSETLPSRLRIFRQICLYKEQIAHVRK